MRLVEVLATGVRGAEGGTVEIYRRGTSTFATVYSDYKGGGASSPTEGIDLDSNGGLTVYVDEEVDCIVRSSSGASVREFTAIGTASSTEVKSQSFTGTDYDTALTAASYPILLSTLLDMWKTNSGAVDWKVLFNGSATTLQTAFSTVAGVFFNVKATTYGAKGDNTTDDTSAIQAAIDAANAVPGGTVYFPGGSYRITSALNLKDRVSILGAGSRAVNILIDHATANAISVAAGVSDQPISVRGVTILPKQANSGKMLAVESGTPVNCFDCCFGGALLTGKAVSAANASTRVVFVGCVFEVNAANGYHFNGTGGAPVFIGCRFIWSATNMTTRCILADGCAVVGCEFDLSAITNAAANGTVIETNVNTGPNFIVASRIVNPSVGTSISDTLDGGTAAGRYVLGWYVPSNVTPVRVRGVTGVGNHEGCLDGGRDSRRYYVTDNAAAITVNPDLYGVIEVRRTTNGVQTVTLGSPPHAGMMCELVWNNDHAAGGGVITLTTVKGLANFTVNANSVSHYFLRSSENVAAGAGSANTYWTLVGSTVNVTP